MDAGGDAVAQRGVLITATVASGGGALSGGSGVRTDDQGRATFTDLVLSGTVGARTLRFQATGLSSVTSEAIDLSAGVPAAMVPGAGNNATAPAGTDLQVSPAVRVSDADGNPVAGVPVDFAVTGGGGSVTGGSQTTGADGVAAVTTWTLGAQPGANTLSATSTSLPGVSVTLSATAVLGPPALVVIVDGDGQSASAGFLVPVSPKVKVTDQAGNPIAGIRVAFAVTLGGGTVLGGNPITGADGTAQVGIWYLGPDPGPNALSATVTGIPAVTFTATATPVPILLVDGDNQLAFAEATLERQLVAYVRNGAGQPQVGVTVTFEVTEGGGSFTTTSSITDAGGFARATWVLGPQAGVQHARVSAPLAADAIASATAVTFRVITAAWHSACGLTPAGTAYCWGSNGYQQLGDATFASVRLKPVLVSGGLEFAAIEGAGSGNFYCAVTAAQAAYCWGSNWHGQPGDGVTPMNPSSTIGTPVPVAGNLSWQVVRPGGDHACGLTTAGEAWCWGANNRAQLGDTVTVNRNYPGPAATGFIFKDLAVGAGHNCGLTLSGDVYCWGSREGFTSLGIKGVPSPTLIPGGIKFESLTAGASTCGLTSDGSAYCWGTNASGQLGDGTTAGSSTPRPVAGGLRFVALSARGSTTCGLVAGGAAYCWGANDAGQAGTGVLGNLLTPTLVSGGLAFTTITVASSTSCGLVGSGVPWCWGPNDSGQVGDGTKLQRGVPTRTRF